MEDLIKALHCLSSQNCMGDCYMEHYNSHHIDDENAMLMRCGEYEDFICCPYYQKKYGVCFEDGECMELLAEAAAIIERMMQEDKS